MAECKSVDRIIQQKLHVVPSRTAAWLIQVAYCLCRSKKSRHSGRNTTLGRREVRCGAAADSVRLIELSLALPFGILIEDCVIRGIFMLLVGGCVFECSKRIDLSP